MFAIANNLVNKVLGRTPRTSFLLGSINIITFQSLQSATKPPVIKAIEHVGKDTYFRDVHLFIERVEDISAIKGDQLIIENLFTCLRGVALQWYTAELSDEAKLLVRYGPGVDHWTTQLHKRFKEAPNVAMAAIHNQR